MVEKLTRAERLMEIPIILFCSPSGVKASEFAKRFGCHRSSIYRDIEILSSRGHPIWEDGQRFRIHKDRSLTYVSVNLNEAQALYLSARLLSAHSDKHNPHVVSALEKLASALPESIGNHIAQTAAITFERKQQPAFLRNLELLTLAWAEKRQTQVTYHNPQTGETTTRFFDPYFIEPSPLGYACYVIGYDHLRKAIRQFKVERIKEVKVLPSCYEVRDDFDPYKYLSGAWGIMGGEEQVTVKLRFSAQVAYRVRESDWPGVDQLEDLPNGGCVMTLKVNHTLEMKPWIRGWGADCEVLEPEDLRQVIAMEMIAAGKMYEKAMAEK